MVGCLLLIYKKNENRVTRIPLYKGVRELSLICGKVFCREGNDRYKNYVKNSLFQTIYTTFVLGCRAWKFGA